MSRTRSASRVIGAAAVVLVAGAAVVVGAVLQSGPAGAEHERWRMIELGTLGGRASEAVALNEADQVVGRSVSRGSWHAFLWEDGAMTDLGTLGGPSSAAVAIDDGGVVIGWSDVGFRTPHAFRWENGELLDLGTLGGAHSAATAINDRGQIVGWSLTRDGKRHAFLWEDGRMRDLGTLGGSTSTARAINNHGAVIGSSLTKDGSSHAFLWEDGRMIDLGTLPRARASDAVAINDERQVVGHSASGRGGGATHAFMWQSGRLVALGSLGGIDSKATAINGRGQVVGLAQSEQGALLPFLWERGHMEGLSSVATGAPGVAWAVNDAGEVAGTSLRRAVVWVNGTTIDLGPPSSQAVAIAESRHVAGVRHTARGWPRAVLWTRR